jgi:hypothetical protein
MRVQVYHEELDNISLVTQTSRNGETFYGLRVWLKTCQELLDHSTPEDDDRSAVTFWAKDLLTLRQLCLDIGLALRGAGDDAAS